MSISFVIFLLFVEIHNRNERKNERKRVDKSGILWYNFSCETKKQRMALSW